MNTFVIIMTVLVGGAIVGLASGITVGLDNRTTRELICCAGLVPVIFISNSLFAARVTDMNSMIACAVAQGIASAVLCYLCVFLLDKIKSKREDPKKQKEEKNTARTAEAVIRAALYYGVFQAIMLSRM